MLHDVLARPAPTIEPALSDPAWYLERLHFPSGGAVFARTTREALAAQVFLDPRYHHPDGPRQGLPLTQLRHAPVPARAPAMIWHTAFCCSTLLADCLDTPGRCLALKEPVALVELAAARQAGWPGAVDDALAVGVFRTLGRGFSPEERVVIKPSNAANGLVGVAAAACPKMVVIYGDCRSFIAAVAGGGEDRRRFVRDLYLGRFLEPGGRFGPAALAAMTDLQVAALLWHRQVAELRALVHALGPERVRVVNCEDFLADPAAVLADLDGFLELDLGYDRIAEIVAGPALRRSAKRPGRPFDRDARRETFERVEASLGGALEMTAIWSYRVCPETPRNDPFGAPQPLA